jgi:hypothetical protein
MAAFLNKLNEASALFARSSIHASYTISQPDAAQVGLWKVHLAKNANGKQVSIFEYDKASSAGSSRKGAQQASRDAIVVETLKREVSTLTRLRHPCLLEVVERMFCLLQPAPFNLCGNSVGRDAERTDLCCGTHHLLP